MSFGEDLDKLVEEHSDGLVGKHPTWERVALKDVTGLVNGFAYKSGHFQETDGTPLLRIRDILKGVPGTRYNAPVDDPKMKTVSDGEIVIGMDGDFNSTIWKGGQALINQRVCSLKANEAVYSQKLLAYALPGYLKLINDHTSSVTVKHLSSKTIQDIPLPLPPFEEQKRIVEKIDMLFARLDKGEEAVREVSRLLTRYRQSVLKSAVTGQLTADWRAQREGGLEDGAEVLARILKTRRENREGRGKYKEPQEPNLTDLHDLPEGWVWASVEQLAKVIGGLTKNSKRKEMPLRRPMLRVANVYQNRLELDDVHDTGVKENELARVLLEPRDLLVVEGNGSKGQIGRMAIWSGEIPNAVHQNHLIKVRLYEKALAEFLITWFQSMMGRQIVERVASSTSGLYTLSISKIEALVAPLPSQEEISEIMTQVEEAFTKIDALERWCETELKRSASLRQSILKDAFAGRLVPQDPNDEPASALLARIATEKASTKKPRRKVPA